MWNYIHTTSTLDFDPVERKLLDENIDNYLYSLINGLQQSKFGLNTLVKVANNNIIPFKKSLNENKRLFIDSGGYSIIVGDVTPRHLNKFIECYCHFLEDYENYYDKIFSLDIPIFLKYPECNNVDFIKKQNDISLRRSKKIILENPKIKDKFVLVWQFKLKKQYKIWNELYHKYFKEMKLNNYGIGGMVGLRGITNINFSPFISMCYKCLNEIIFGTARSNLIHLLGVYGLHDRFIMCFIDRLFNEIYLKDREVEVTYDTINYSVGGYMKVRNLSQIIFENDRYISKEVVKLTENEVEKIIQDNECREQICKDIFNLSKDKQIEKTHVFAVLNVIYNLEIDNIIKKIIYNKDNQLFNHFINCKNYNQFKGKALSILNGYNTKYPFIFKNRINKNMVNFRYLYAFHNWFLNEKDNIQKFEMMHEKFTDHINFPFDIEGEY